MAKTITTVKDAREELQKLRAEINKLKRGKDLEGASGAFESHDNKTVVVRDGAIKEIKDNRFS